jgi:serine/threonine-protein kinase
MQARDLLLLPADVLMTRVADLDPQVSRRFLWDADDVLVSRPLRRTRSLVVDQEGAAVLQCFREPHTVVDACLRYCRERQSDPQQTLEMAVPLIVRARRLRLLAVSGTAEADSVQPSFSEGDEVGGYRVLALVHLLDDAEVYRATARDGRVVALKVLRTTGPSKAGQRLEREIAVLHRLDGNSAPRLVEHGWLGQRRFLVTSWCAGVDAAAAAARLRTSGERARHALAGLCARILHRYGQLHASGLLHGDVHPENIIIGPTHEVCLLDFGLGCAIAPGDDLAPLARAGVAEYFEPEYCDAVRRGAALPGPTPASEQYSVATLCYLLLAGCHPFELRLDRRDWAEQVAEAPPRPLAQVPGSNWTAVSQVLDRALSKAPGQRFASMAAFSQAFERAAASDLAAALRPDRTEAFLLGVLQRFALSNGALPSGLCAAPRCSVNYGAGGIAYFYYRLAALRADAHLLATADAWCSWALHNADASGAFHNEHLKLTEQVVGRGSLYHSRAGLHLTQALISKSMGDAHTAGVQLGCFLRAVESLDDQIDLAGGAAGLLLGCATLAERLQGTPAPELAPLAAQGARLAQAVTPWLERGRLDAAVGWTGIAHGWAGLLYALLRWQQASGTLIDAIEPGLVELSALGHRDGRQASWPLRTGPNHRTGSARTGWCHGSAGYVLLWLLADRLFPGRGFDRDADGAARHLWQSRDQTSKVNGSLCCGFGGQAFALLAMYREGQGRVWLERARVLTQCATTQAPNTECRASLYKGDVGIALLVQSVLHPEGTGMPLFESEGWARD